MKKKQQHISETLLLKILENTANEKEKLLFNNWLEASSKNAADFAKLKWLFQFISVDKNNLRNNWEQIVHKFNSGNTLPIYVELPVEHTHSVYLNWNYIVRVAAIIIVFLGVPYLFNSIVLNSEQLTISGSELPLNEPYQLADGSFVYLNGNSEISFSKKYGIKNRNVSLKGEAFFEVQPNKDIPFIISTGKTTTQVIGTSFNVYSDQSEQVKVSVVSGTVMFCSRKKKSLVRLSVGDQGIYNPQLADIEKQKMNNQNFLAWKTGILNFNKTPVLDAFHLLQKQYSRVFIFETTKKDMPTLTTIFDNQPIEEVLEEINILLNTKTDIKNDTIYFKSNK